MWQERMKGLIGKTGEKRAHFLISTHRLKDTIQVALNGK